MDRRLQALTCALKKEVHATNCDVQNFVSGTPEAKGTVRFAVETWKSATLVLHAEWIEYPLNAIVCKFREDVNCANFFNKLTQHFFGYQQVITITLTYHAIRSTTIDGPLYFHYAGTSVHGQNE